MTPSEVASAFYAAVSQCPSDFETMLALLDSEISWTLCEGHRQAGSYRGLGAMATEMQPGMDADWTGGIVYLADHVVDEGDTCLAMGWFRSTSTRTGEPVAIRFAHRWVVRDGRAVEFEELLDTAVAWRAAG